MIAPAACVALLALQDPLPLELQAVLTPVNDAGEFELRCMLTPLEDLSRTLQLELALAGTWEDVARFEHELATPEDGWSAGATSFHSVPLLLPSEVELEPGQVLGLRLGLRQGSDAPRPPRGELAERVEEDGLAELDVLEVPRFWGEAGAARLAEVSAEGLAAKRAGEVARAWELVESALRDARDDATNEQLRDVLLEIGEADPAPITPLEERVVASRIRDEQARYFRLVAGRLHARGMLHGALRLLEEAGGALEENAGEAVLGAVDDADRVTRRIEDIEERLLSELTGEEQGLVDAQLAELGRTPELLEAARRRIERGEYPVGMELLRKLRRVEGIELYDEAQELLEEASEAYLALTPPDQMAEVTAAREHPAWERLDTVASHRFLFIGPRRLVRGIPKESALRFDLAYVFQTDLFGRIPNPEGDRITVFWKELWDFGGGVGGGKIIDIGNASPDPGRPTRVDNGLLYHELTHCIDDTRPVYGGFHEGLANLGAAYSHEALDQDGDALHSFEGNLEQFQQYFVERDLEYWRIQEYGPSAGFFLHFVEAYAKRGRADHDWTPLRRFFREYREVAVRDGREREVARSLAHHLVRAFGFQAFDDMLRFGFPLVEGDRRWIGPELLALETGELEAWDRAWELHPTSPLPRDLLGRDMLAEERWEREGSAELRQELGVIFDWKTCGPFFAERADPLACVFPPELEVDLTDKPRTLRASRNDWTQRVWQDPRPSWVQPNAHANVRLLPSGWLRFDYKPYGDDNSAIYAFTNVTLSEASDVLVHVRADDDVAVFLDDVRLGSYRGRGANSSNMGWRGPARDLPDAMRFEAHLEPGRHALLVKIRNRAGRAGLAVALSRPDGGPLSFTTDTGQPEALPEPEEPRWRNGIDLDHRGYRSKGEVAVGGFRARNRTWFGAEDDGGVAWRLFTVRPGFPKDSPSNLIWIKERNTRDLEDVRVRLALEAEARAPKLVLTLQGEGGNDGLSGWNLILVPRGQDRVSARLERYDRLVYECDPVELAAVEEQRVLEVVYHDGWFRAHLDEVPLFERVSIDPIPDRHRIGLATWGATPAIVEWEVEEGR